MSDFWLNFDSATDDPACWSWPIPDLGELDDYEQRRALRRWQNKRCAICEDDDCQLVRDHDHVTGLVRGLLCPQCNNAEGRVFGDAATNVYAKWRACPATAVLGVRFMYRSSDGRIPTSCDEYTGYTYLPEHAPDHHGWPHAFDCDVRPTLLGVFECDHPHPRPLQPARTTTVEELLTAFARMYQTP